MNRRVVIGTSTESTVTRMSDRHLPTLAAIWRYPVKSLQGDGIDAAILESSGIFGDRPFALAESATGKVLSAKHPKVGNRLLGLHARYRVEPVPGAPLPDVVVTIDGEEIDTRDPAEFALWCSAALGLEVELAAAGVAAANYESYWPEIEGLALSDVTIDLPAALAERGSFADLEPLHVLTTASLARLRELLPDSAIAVERFRPGLVLDTGDAVGFIENDWAGREAELGEATIRFGSPSPRCVMTTRPQPGLDRDVAILQTLATANRLPYGGFGDFACLGCYAEVVSPGRISVGNELHWAS